MVVQLPRLVVGAGSRVEIGLNHHRLWKEGKVPPTRKLTIKEIDRDELSIAARWQSR